ncbi:hypothetical protein [Litorivivens sp.]|uniref:hypothetical protein n=1 Tax=Litorivivens sp. TaxID=2020868 RepID=UPI003561AD81
MDVVKTIRPGQHGSHRFLEEWGNKLVAVRYRKDQNRMFTTIELIVDERPVSSTSLKILQLTGRNRAVALRINFDEVELRHRVKSAGARWSPELKLWLLPYNDAVKMGLRDRIVKGAAERCTDIDMDSQR